MRGRPRKKRKKPSILKYIEGTDCYRGLAADEPTPDLLSPDAKPPEHLNELEAKYWTQAVSHLCHMRLLAVVDLASVERYAQLRAIWDDAMERGRRDGWYARRTKQDRENPGKWIVVSSADAAWLRTVKSIALMLLRYESEFGFTPSSRTVLSTDANKGTNLEDSIEAFIESGSD